MRKAFFVILVFLLVASACRRDEWTIEGDNPMERTMLLFPGTQKSMIIKAPNYMQKIDIGLDFDIPADSLELKILSSGHVYRGTRVAGTFMPLVACGIPTSEDGITLQLRQRALAKSAWIAIRVAPSVSKMCSPTTPIWDDYVVRR